LKRRRLLSLVVLKWTTNKKSGSAFVRSEQRLKWNEKLGYEKKELKRWRRRKKRPTSGEKMKRAERKTLWA
jgi:hypothetical protein